MSPLSNIRIDWKTAGVAPRDAELILRDDDFWPGIHIERWRCGLIQIEEAVAQTHIMAVTLVSHSDAEFYHAGEGWKRGTRAPGSIKVTPAGVPFATKSSPWFGLIVSIDPEFLSVAGAGDRVELRPQAFFTDPFLTRLALALERDILDGYPVGPAYGESISATLVAHLIRDLSTRSLVLSDEGNGLSKYAQAKIRDYIHSNLQRSLRLIELAKLVQMDMWTFQRRFKQSFAMPPHHYILRARVEHAKSLITNTSLPLVEVALTSGFSSQSHMTTVFRRLTGHSPGDCRA